MALKMAALARAMLSVVAVVTAAVEEDVLPTVRLTPMSTRLRLVCLFRRESLSWSGITGCCYWAISHTPSPLGSKPLSTWRGGKNHSCMTHQSEKYFQNLTPSLWPVLKQEPKLYQKKRKKLKHFFIYWKSQNPLTSRELE